MAQPPIPKKRTTNRPPQIKKAAGWKKRMRLGYPRIRFLFVLDAVAFMGKSVNQIAFHNQICVECTKIGNALAFILII